MPALVQARVASRRGEPDSGVVLVLEAAEMASWTCLPGQFVMAASAAGESVPAPLLKRALAVYDLPGTAQQLAVLLKVLGDGTRRLATLRPGDAVELVGPLGNGFDLDPAGGRHNVVVAGGTGIASVLLLTRRLAESGEQLTLLYGGQRRADLVGLEDFEALGIDIRCTTEDGSYGRTGLITEPLREMLAAGGDYNLYTCGPNPMMRAVAELAAKANAPCQLSVESKMACGFGVCLGCTVRTRTSLRLACTHGPVFDASELIWEPTGLPEPVAS